MDENTIKDMQDYLKMQIEDKQHIKNLEQEKAELIKMLEFHMQFNCACFDKCCNISYQCTNKNNCRYIMSRNLLDKLKDN